MDRGSLAQSLGCIFQRLRDVNDFEGRPQPLLEFPVEAKEFFVQSLHRALPPAVPSVPVGVLPNEPSTADASLATAAAEDVQEAASSSTPNRVGPPPSASPDLLIPRGISAASPPSSMTTPRRSGPILSQEAPPFPPPCPPNVPQEIYWSGRSMVLVNRESAHGACSR